MNNPLIFTDPSGYRPAAIFEEEGRIRSTSGGYNSWNPFGWINHWGHAQGTESEWTIKRTNYLAAMRSLKNSKYGGSWDPSMSSPYYYTMGESYARAFQDVSETVLGEDGLGNQEVLVENNLTGYTYSKKVPFFNITGSYYNHEPEL